MKKILLVVLLLLIVSCSVFGLSFLTTGRAHAQTGPKYTFDNALIAQYAIDTMRSLITKDAKGNPVYNPYKDAVDGDCWPFVRDMLFQVSKDQGVKVPIDISNQAGGNSYFDHLKNAGGYRLQPTDMPIAGDIVQEGDVGGGHTTIIVAAITTSEYNNGWYYVVDSDSDWLGPPHAYVDKVKLYARQLMPTTKHGTTAIFRFGAVDQYLPPTSSSYAAYAGRVLNLGNTRYNQYYVSPWFKRYWVPNYATFGCMYHFGMEVGASGDLLKAIPDQWGQYAACGVSRLYVNQHMFRGWFSLWSSNNAYQLTFQEDGNIVLYGPNNKVHFATGTNGTFIGLDDLVMQSDGNLVGYSVRGEGKTWASGTSGKPNISYLEVTDNGHLNLCDKNHHTIYTIV